MRQLLLIFLSVLSFHLFGSEKDIQGMLDEARKKYKTNKDSARILEQRALNLAMEENYDEGTVRAHYYLGFYYENAESNHQLALRNYLAAIEYTSQDHDSTSRMWAAYSYLNGGLLLSDFNLYDESIDLYEKALEIMQELDNTREINKIERNIALAKFELGLYHESIEIMQGILLRVSSAEDAYFSALNRIGICHTYLGNYSKAEETFQTLINASKQSKENRNKYIYYSLHNIADMYLVNGEWEKASEYLGQKIKWMETDENVPANSLFVYYKDFLRLNNELANHEVIYKINSQIDSLMAAIKSQDPGYYITIYPLISEAYEKSGNEKRAEYYRDVYEKDSLKYIDDRKKLNLESRSEELRAIVDAYYSELAAEQNAKRTESILISIIVGLVAMLLFLLGYQIYRHYLTRRLINQGLEKLNMDE